MHHFEAGLPLRCGRIGSKVSRHLMQRMQRACGEPDCRTVKRKLNSSRYCETAVIKFLHQVARSRAAISAAHPTNAELGPAPARLRLSPSIACSPTRSGWESPTVEGAGLNAGGSVGPSQLSRAAGIWAPARSTFLALYSCHSKVILDTAATNR